ncbi:hypothetical protein ACFX1Z_037856 [Malus domestica]
MSGLVVVAVVIEEAHVGVATMAIAEGLEPSWFEFTDELVYGEPGRSADKVGDLHCPVLPSSLVGDVVVADVMEWDWGDESVVHEAGGWRFVVERMFSNEAEH